MNILSESQQKNLEVIFTLARQACVNNKAQLIGVINFEDELNKALNLPEVKVDEAIKPE